jgi:hypothetical protein
MSLTPDKDVSTPLKKVRKVGTAVTDHDDRSNVRPSPTDLLGELASFAGSYSTPIRDKLKAVTIQNHHRKLMNHYLQSGGGGSPTPNTKLFLRSGQHLVEVGADSMVDDRGELLRQIGEAYLNQSK